MDLKLLIKDKRMIYIIVALVAILVVLSWISLFYKGSLVMPPSNTKQFSIGGTVSAIATDKDGTSTYTLKTALPYSKFGKSNLVEIDKTFYIDNKSVVQVLTKDEKGDWVSAKPTIVRDASGKVIKISGFMAVNIIREGDSISISTKENVFSSDNFHADKVIIYR